MGGDAAGPAHENTISATITDGDGDEGTDKDTETVDITDVPPAITVDKTASDASVDESGEMVTFAVAVTNDTSEWVTLVDLTDDVYGDLLDSANSAVSSNTCPAQSKAIAAAGRLACTFDALVAGDASGPDHENTVTATVVDDDGTGADDDDSAIVTFDDTPPSVVVDKTATAGAVAEPGADVTFIVEILNDGDESVTITDLTDDVYGDLFDPANAAASNNTCASEPRDVAVGGTFRCTFDGFVGGDAFGPDHVNTVTVRAIDNDGTPTEDDDSVTIPIEPSLLPATVSGYVWFDLNPNLEFDAPEPPYSGLIVRILNAAGIEVDSAPVSSEGYYEFADLAPGNYTIIVDDSTVDPGYVVVLDPDGINDLQTAVSLTAGEHLVHRDFAYRGDAEIGDTVWRDDNRNGIQDAGEPGIAGVGVEIVWAGPDGVFGTDDEYRFPKTTTDGSGMYMFDDLPPGSYVIAVDTVSGLTPTTPTSYAVDVSPSQVYLDGDFGMAAPPASPPSTPLPKTGSDTDLLTLTGFIAIAVGALMLVGAAVLQRRRYGLELPPTE
jgi:LPXTG-motif cell wall-anchored protein